MSSTLTSYEDDHDILKGLSEKSMSGDKEGGLRLREVFLDRSFSHAALKPRPYE